MSAPLPKPWTVDDFLEWEAQQEERYEFIDGRILARVGANAAHATIKDNVTGCLRSRLRGRPCRAFSEDLKVVTATATHYPDVVVTWSPIEPTADRVAEPVVIVEVLSRTTADRDRSAKWGSYREIDSLENYILIAQDRRQVELHGRTGKGWTLEIIRGDDDAPVPLPAIGVELSLDGISEDSGA